MTVSKDFVLAGNATFTISAPDKHRTYRVSFVAGKERHGGGRWPDAYFVHTLTGPNNETDYSYLGMLNPGTGEVFITRASTSWGGTMRLRLLNRVLARVWAGDHAAYQGHGYDTMHAGCCGRCGRKLTTPDSIESGIGPECRKLYDLRLPPGTPAEVAAKAKAAAPRKPRGRKGRAAVAQPVPVPGGETVQDAFELSDRPGFDPRGLLPHYQNGELVKWTGRRGGVEYTVFND